MSNEALEYVGDLTPRELDIECYHNLHKDTFGCRRLIDWDLVTDEELTEMIESLVRYRREDEERMKKHLAQAEARRKARAKANRENKRKCYPTLAAIWPK